MPDQAPLRVHNLTYREIINDFTTAVDSNLSVGTFDTGTIDYLDANAVNKTYPYIYLRPITSQGVVDRVRGITFELYSLDVPKLSDESPVGTLSDTENRIYDILSYFNYGPTDIQQKYQVEITSLAPVNEAFQDRVYGWVATIDVTSAWKWNYCDYPNGQDNYPTPTPVPTPAPIAPPIPVPTSSFAIRISDYSGSAITASCYDGTNDVSQSVIAYAIVTSSISFPDNISGSALYFDSGATMPFSMSNDSVPSGSMFSIISGSITGSRTHAVYINTGSGWPSGSISGSQWAISGSVSECPEVGVIYTNFSASANPLDGCAYSGSEFTSSLYYHKKPGKVYPCDIEDSFLYTDTGATQLWSGALDASGSIPTGSDWLMIADTTSSISSSYNLHMYHREEEPSGSVYVQEIWSCEDNQRTCLQ